MNADMRDHFSRCDGVTAPEQLETQLKQLVMGQVSQKHVTWLLTMNADMRDPFSRCNGITAPLSIGNATETTSSEAGVAETCSMVADNEHGHA